MLKATSVFVALLVWATPVLAESPEPVRERAVTVDIRGGFVGFDKAAYRKVRRQMGRFVAAGAVDHLITQTHGLEGGGKYCLELARFTELQLSDLKSRFDAIKADERTTIYEVATAASCEKP